MLEIQTQSLQQKQDYQHCKEGEKEVDAWLGWNWQLKMVKIPDSEGLYSVKLSFWVIFYKDK